MYISQQFKEFVKGKEDRLLSLLLAIAILLFFYNLWVPSIWNPNEAFYAEGAREMLETGNFLVPHFNYEPRFQKPILLYWCVAAMYQIFGISEFTARLVSSLLASATVLITFLIAKLLYNTRAGLLSAVVLATSFEFNQQARYMSPEMTLLFFITFSLYAFLLGTKGNNTFWLFISYLCMGLAVLTKGPVGFVLPMMIIALYLILLRDKKIFSAAKFHYGIPFIILIAAPWFLFMSYTYGQQYTSVVWGENFKRFMGQYGKASNLFYYFSVLPWNFLPWFPFFFMAFFSNIKRFVKKELDSDTLFIVIWFFTVFCFFSISQGKLPPYLLPLFPAASILVGKYFEEKIKTYQSAEKFLLFLSFFMILLIIMAYTLLHITLDLKAYVLFICLVLLLWPLLIMLKNFRPLTLFFSIASAMLLFYFLFLSFILPSVEMNRQPYRMLGDIISKHDPQKRAAFLSLGYAPQNLSFYARRKITQIKDIRSTEFQEPLAPMIIMLKQKDVNQLHEKMRNSCETICQFELYTKSESRFLSFLNALRTKKDFEFFLLLSCNM